MGLEPNAADPRLPGAVIPLRQARFRRSAREQTGQHDRAEHEKEEKCDAEVTGANKSQEQRV
jgi:hypothetical protein